MATTGIAAELESDVLDTVAWGRKWFDFTAGKTQLVSFHLSNNTGAIDVTMENHLLRCWGCPSLLNWIDVLKSSRLPELPPRKLEP